MTSVVMTAQSFANRQHSAVFYQLGCATYPLVLVAQSVAGRLRAPASGAALAYMGFTAAMVWILPLVPASPQAGPVYNALDHLLPPPFPLLLVVPALALDAWLHGLPARERGAARWTAALAAGLSFFAPFVAAPRALARVPLSPPAGDPPVAGRARVPPLLS